MQASENVRAARKKMQLDRLAKKADPDYTKFYANQPLQRVKAVKNDEIKVARKALRDATENLAIAEVTGEGLQAAQEAQAIAALVVHKLSSRDTSPGATLLAG